MVGNPIEVAERIRPDANRREHRAIELVEGPPGRPGDGVIEGRPAAQHAQDDLREQRHLTRIAHFGASRFEESRRERAGVLDPPQDPERFTPRVRGVQSDLPDTADVR